MEEKKEKKRKEMRPSPTHVHARAARSWRSPRYYLPRSSSRVQQKLPVVRTRPCSSSLVLAVSPPPRAAVGRPRASCCAPVSLSLTATRTWPLAVLARGAWTKDGRRARLGVASRRAIRPDGRGSAQREGRGVPRWESPISAPNDPYALHARGQRIQIRSLIFSYIFLYFPIFCYILLYFLIFSYIFLHFLIVSFFFVYAKR